MEKQKEALRKLLGAPSMPLMESETDEDVFHTPFATYLVVTDDKAGELAIQALEEEIEDRGISPRPTKREWIDVRLRNGYGPILAIDGIERNMDGMCIYQL